MTSKIVPRYRFQVGYNPCAPNQQPELQTLPFIRPWARFETSCTNFEQFSKQELQMRLKAEVLQYKRKHLRYTKAEIYSLAARNTFTKRNYLPKAHIDENGNLVAPQNTNIIYSDTDIALALEFDDITCDNSNIVYNKSSASDVPGPIVDLYLDPSVPVFNFGNPPRRYLAGGTYNVDNTIFDDVTDAQAELEYEQAILNEDVIAQLAATEQAVQTAAENIEIEDHSIGKNRHRSPKFKMKFSKNK